MHSVYRNLHKECWSIKFKQLVVDHSQYEVIKDAQFVVQPRGNEKVRSEKKKNVHAWVKGKRLNDVVYSKDNLLEVTYDPYKHESFVFVESGEPVFNADLVVMDFPKVFVVAE